MLKVAADAADEVMEKDMLAKARKCDIGREGPYVYHQMLREDKFIKYCIILKQY